MRLMLSRALTNQTRPQTRWEQLREIILDNVIVIGFGIFIGSIFTWLGLSNLL